MRSQLVFEASRVIPARFLLSALLAKGTRAFHRPRTRLAGTVNLVLGEIAASGGATTPINTNKCDPWPSRAPQGPPLALPAGP